MKVTLIGAGNLATQLGQSLAEKGIEIRQVWSRTEDSSRTLAERLGTRHTTNIKEIEEGADYYIYSLKDDALKETIAKVEAYGGIHLHTAGSVGMDVFDGSGKRYGVMYPMQTFSKEKKVDFAKIPVFAEGQDKATTEAIMDLGRRVSENVTECDSKQRMTLHIAAVFCCNYNNFVCSIAEKLMEANGLDFKVMFPLIDETAEKLHHMRANDAQTGPASRGDKEVMDKHIAALSEWPEYKSIYETLAKGIMNKKQ